MTNVYFPDETITENDLYFICYMIERIARRIKQKNKYVINMIGKKSLKHLISVANVLHSENPKAVEDEWINNYNLERGTFDISKINKELVNEIPRATQMGKVYQRLIRDTLLPDEDYIDGIIRVYNNSICDVIDNYNCSAYYEPSYTIARAYQNGGF